LDKIAKFGWFEFLKKGQKTTVRNSQVINVILIKDSICPTLLISKACIITKGQSQSKPGTFYPNIMDTTNITVCR
jgi:hypothetical protein